MIIARFELYSKVSVELLNKYLEFIKIAQVCCYLFPKEMVNPGSHSCLLAALKVI